MKKAIIIVIVLLGMFGWAVYDFVSQRDDASVAEDLQQEKLTLVSDGEKKVAETAVGLNIGDIAPDFELQTLKGEKVKLSDYRGKRVMLNFWASWCPPCQAEMPDMEKFNQDTDVVILAVNLTETEPSVQEVKDFVEYYKLTFPILMDEESTVAAKYQISPIPTSFMIDSKGIIQFKTLGSLNHDTMVHEFEKMK